MRTILRPLCTTCFTLLLIVFASYDLQAQTTLNPGDVVITGYNFSGSPNNTSGDNFSFLILVDIESGTEIKFTDNGWRCPDNSFYSTEGHMKFTATTDVPKGTQITCHPNATFISGSEYGTLARFSGDFNFNKDGEQILIYQGTTASPTLLFGITSNNDGSWDADADDSHTSAYPDACGSTNTPAIAIPYSGGDVMNNAYFDCSLVSGSRDAILAAITDNNNWLGSETAIVPTGSCPFSLTPMLFSYITYDQMQLEWQAPAGGRNLVILCKEGSAITATPGTDDGTTYSAGANTNYNSGTNIGDNTYVIYNGTDTSASSGGYNIVGGMTEGNTYYFQAYTYLTASPTVWTDQGTSEPESQVAEVQPVSDSSIALSGTDVVIDWTNYIGDPQSAWWDGGAIILHKESSAVPVTQANMNARSASVGEGSFTAGTSLNAWGGNFTGVDVAATDAGGSPAGTETATISGLAPGITHHFAIFHNDGKSDNDDKWSDPTLLSIYIPAAEMSVEGNSVEIADGDNTPSTTDATDFGTINKDATKVVTFTIKNTGDGALNLTGTPDVTISGGSGKFTVTSQPSSSTLAATNGEETFQITFNPGGATGSWTASVSIANTDPNENPYTFDIKGTSVNGIDFTPKTGPVGTTIVITGQDFTGATSVSVNGTAVDSYTVDSDSQITAVVADGTTSGQVQVISPGGGTQNSTDDYVVIDAAGQCIF